MDLNTAHLLETEQFDKDGSLLRTALEPLEPSVQSKILHKLLSIAYNTAHHLHSNLIAMSCVRDLFGFAAIQTGTADHSRSQL